MPLQISKIVGLAALATLVVAGLTPTPSHAKSVKADPIAAKGCRALPTLEASQSVIKRYNYTVQNAKPAEIQTLGAVLIQIEKLNGGQPLVDAVADASGYKFVYRDLVRNSHQRVGEIGVNRNGAKRYGHNAAQIAHEIGHFIGNRGVYEDYKAAIGGARKYCEVSDYSDNKPNEQFAEVFAAFVTRPELLKSNPSETCKRTYKFLANYFKGEAVDITSTCIDRQRVLEDQMGLSGVATTFTVAPAWRPNAKVITSESAAAQPRSSNAAN